MTELYGEQVSAVVNYFGISVAAPSAEVPWDLTGKYFKWDKRITR